MTKVSHYWGGLIVGLAILFQPIAFPSNLEARSDGVPNQWQKSDKHLVSGISFYIGGRRGGVYYSNRKGYRGYYRPYYYNYYRPYYRYYYTPNYYYRPYYYDNYYDSCYGGNCTDQSYDQNFVLRASSSVRSVEVLDNGTTRIHLASGMSFDVSAVNLPISEDDYVNVYSKRTQSDGMQYRLMINGYEYNAIRRE